MNTTFRRCLLGLFTVTFAIVSLTTTVIESRPAHAANRSIEVWWPTESEAVSGVQPFKAVVTGMQLHQYRMYWQKDGGARNAMVDSYEGHPHKADVVDVGLWGEGWHQVTFVATRANGRTLAERTLTINVVGTDPVDETTSTTQQSTTTTADSTTTTVQSTTTTAPTTTTTSEMTLSGLVGATLYVDPWSQPKAAADSLRDDQPYEASLLDKIADNSFARWLGDWSGDIYTAAKSATDIITAADAYPVFVAYNIPMRDCSGYSVGGAQSADDYRSWIASLAQGIGDRGAAVVLEPDALPLLDCLSEDLKTERLNLLQEAVGTLSASGTVSVYIDAGHAHWHTPEEMANRLRAAGVDGARGFSLNVSNFIGTADTVAYGEKVSTLLNGKPFVVDTSRNGLGPSPDGEWCNPSGRALGLPPDTGTGNPAVDAYLWIKVPGESDGTCNGGPEAGRFWIDYALGLAERADW